jgi:hypothetical protein
MTKSTRPTVRIHDIATNQVVDREMTDDEFSQYQASQAASAEREAEFKSKEIAKASLLNKLGITAEEAALLLS